MSRVSLRLAFVSPPPLPYSIYLYQNGPTSASHPLIKVCQSHMKPRLLFFIIHYIIYHNLLFLYREKLYSCWTVKILYANTLFFFNIL